MAIQDGDGTLALTKADEKRTLLLFEEIPRGGGVRESSFSKQMYL